MWNLWLLHRQLSILRWAPQEAKSIDEQVERVKQLIAVCWGQQIRELNEVWFGWLEDGLRGYGRAPRQCSAKSSWRQQTNQTEWGSEGRNERRQLKKWNCWSEMEQQPPINFIKFKDKSFLLIHWLLKKWIKRYYNSNLRLLKYLKDLGWNHDWWLKERYWKIF